MFSNTFEVLLSYKYAEMTLELPAGWPLAAIFKLNL